MHAEGLLDVLGQGVHLQGEVLAVHRVQKVEPDGEVQAKARVHAVAQERARRKEHQILRRHLHDGVPALEQQAVLLRHAVKAPGVVLLGGVQAADLLHPLPAPDAGVEVRRHAEGALRHERQRRAEVLAPHHHGLVALVRLQEVVDLGHHGALVSVADAPVDEVAALDLAQRLLALVVRAVVADLARAVAQLDLPAGQVRVDEHVALGDERGTHAVQERDPLGLLRAAAEHGGAGKRGGRGEDGAAECGGAGRSAGKGKARRALNIRPAEIHTKSIPENGGAV